MVIRARSRSWCTTKGARAPRRSLVRVSWRPELQERADVSETPAAVFRPSDAGSGSPEHGGRGPSLGRTLASSGANGGFAMGKPTRSVRVAMRLVGALLVAPLLVIVASAPAQAAPLSARSYYVSSFDLSWAYDRGCTAGSADADEPGTQTRYVVLDFGSMYQQADGDWYVTFFGGTDRPLWRARNMVQEWAKGYWTCTGGDVNSVAYVGLGTNNSGGDVTYAAGDALATSAKTAIANLQDAGNYYDQGRPVGANDFEDWGQGTSLNSKSRSWINGYNSVSGRPIFVNYGAAGGCPQSSVPSPSSCNPGLNAETIWQVSWSGVAYPLPEIYATSGANAKQWRYLSKYSIVEKGSSKFIFKGVMAQSGACSQSGGCSGTDNTPSEAWDQLNNQLNQDPAVDTTPGSPTNIWWGPS